jgi:hypothetical protein
VRQPKRMLDITAKKDAGPPSSSRPRMATRRRCGRWCRTAAPTPALPTTMAPPRLGCGPEWPHGDGAGAGAGVRRRPQRSKNAGRHSRYGGPRKRPLGHGFQSRDGAGGRRAGIQQRRRLVPPLCCRGAIRDGASERASHQGGGCNHGARGASSCYLRPISIPA